MNTPTNAPPDPPLASPVTAPAAMLPTRPMYWSVRRELWENRSIYVAPMAVAAVAAFGSLISTIVLAQKLRVSASDPATLRALVRPPGLAAAMIIVTAFLVGAFYCLDALHGERRDRSILFWKSLPVSDLTTVLSKASIPLVVLPLLAFVVALATQEVMLLLSTAVLLGRGLNGASLWTRWSLLQMPLVMFYGLTAHVLWYAPIYAWLLLVSAWARRATLLWTVLPFIAVNVVEKVAFGTSHCASVLIYRLRGAMAEAFTVDAATGPVNQLSQLDPLKFLRSSGLWIGLALTVAFVAAAVWLRRNREPI